MRTIERFEIPDANRTAQNNFLSAGHIEGVQRADEIAGQNEIVLSSIIAMRVEAIARRIERPGLDKVFARIIFDQASWISAVRRAHESRQKPPLSKPFISSAIDAWGGLLELRKTGSRGSLTSKKKT